MSRWKTSKVQSRCAKRTDRQLELFLNYSISITKDARGVSVFMAVRSRQLLLRIFRQRDLGRANILEFHGRCLADVHFALFFANRDLASDAELILRELAVFDPELHGPFRLRRLGGAPAQASEQRQ